jgi:hypothetical protein
MTLLRTSVWFICITALFVSLDCPAATSVPPASELLDKYAKALDSTQSFISFWEYSGVMSYRIPSWGMEVDNVKKFSRGEHRTDNKGRKYTRDYSWGYQSSIYPNLSGDNAKYGMNIIGSDFTYRNEQKLGDNPYDFPGRVDYRKRGTKGWDIPDRKTWGYFDNGANSAFLGYFYTQERLDRILRKKKRLYLRPKPENVNGSLCYVLEADTPYGDFKIWLDSEHGYHPARIRATVTVGDDIGDPGRPHIITKAEAITRKFIVDNVRFEKIDGVWVPMETDNTTHIILGSENGFSRSMYNFKRTKIVLNPDHDALGSFTDPIENPGIDPELRNGTEMNLNLGDDIERVWRDGKPIPLE